MFRKDITLFKKTSLNRLSPCGTGFEKLPNPVAKADKLN
jgi:hypothetical protein